MTEFSALPPHGLVAPLPLFRTALQAYSFTFRRLGQLSVAAAIPFLASTAVLLAAAGLWAQVELRLPLILTVFLLQVCAYSLFAVAWHRAVLLGERSRLLPPLRRRHLRFALLSLPFSLILSVYCVPLSLGFLFSSEYLLFLLLISHEETGMPPNLIRSILTMTLLLLIVLLVVAYPLARFLLVMPAAAVDERFGFLASWRATAESNWNLLGACILAPIPVALVFALSVLQQGSFLRGLIMGLQMFILPTLSRAELLLLFLPAIAAGYILAAVLTAVLSLCYRTCTSWVPDRSDGTA